MIVASHNLMTGLRLGGLIAEHVGLRAARGLAALCVQENDEVGGERCAPQIAAALGPRYRVLCDPAAPRLAVIYDGAALRCRSHEVLELPRLARLRRFERIYISEGKVVAKHALLAVFAAAGGGEPFVAANFHLDTAGTNAHRRRQIAAIAGALQRRGLARVIACGDTNAFGWRRQLAELAGVLAPLAARGAVDPGRRPTHYFARQCEPGAAHRAVAWVGRLGIDLPCRYDVVCTGLARERGQVVTPDSDHDLVWARI